MKPLKTIKMTKEEKIKEAYLSEFKNIEIDHDKRYDGLKPWVDNYGWFSGKLHDVDMNNFDISGHEIRPKSLQGIEDNNGWIKINSEDDLPNTELDCHFVKDNLMYQGVWDNILKGFYHGLQKINATHYQPVQKPNPPLY